MKALASLVRAVLVAARVVIKAARAESAASSLALYRAMETGEMHTNPNMGPR